MVQILQELSNLRQWKIHMNSENILAHILRQQVKAFPLSGVWLNSFESTPALPSPPITSQYHDMPLRLIWRNVSNLRLEFEGGGGSSFSSALKCVWHKFGHRAIDEDKFFKFQDKKGAQIKCTFPVQSSVGFLNYLSWKRCILEWQWRNLSRSQGKSKFSPESATASNCPKRCKKWNT